MNILIYLVFIGIYLTFVTGFALYALIEDKVIMVAITVLSAAVAWYLYIKTLVQVIGI